MSSAVSFIFYLIIVIFSVVLHELAHGFMAKRLGDDTAEEAGRLTLNPLKHLDPFGSVILPLIFYFTGLPGLAWAKPVPYNPSRLYKDYKYGPLKVALAGPATNLGIMIVFGLLARLLIGVISPITVASLGLIGLVNAFLAVFNLLPIPPLDGARVLPLLLPRRYEHLIDQIGFAGFFLVLLFIYLFQGVIVTVATYVFGLFAGGQVLGVLSAIL